MNMMILLVTILFYYYQVGSNNQKQFICQHNLNYKTLSKCSTGMLIQSEIMYSYIMIMAAVLVTTLAHFYNVGINNKPCCSQHYMSIPNALHLVYSAQECVLIREHNLLNYNYGGDFGRHLFCCYDVGS